MTPHPRRPLALTVSLFLATTGVALAQSNTVPAPPGPFLGAPMGTMMQQLPQAIPFNRPTWGQTQRLPYWMQPTQGATVEPVEPASQPEQTTPDQDFHFVSGQGWMPATAGTQTQERAAQRSQTNLRVQGGAGFSGNAGSSATSQSNFAPGYGRAATPGFFPGYTANPNSNAYNAPSQNAPQRQATNNQGNTANYPSQYGGQSAPQYGGQFPNGYGFQQAPWGMPGFNQAPMLPNGNGFFPMGNGFGFAPGYGAPAWQQR